MLAIWLEISSVALAVWPARLLTSCATTAKPRPASPARAASMVALSASRLVCSAIEVISFTTSPIRVPACDSSVMRWSVASAWLTASAAIAVGFLNAAGDFADRAATVRRRRRPRCGRARRRSRRRWRTSPDRSAVVRAVSVSWCAIALELAGGIHHLVDDAADAGLELVDETAQFRLALLGGGGSRSGLLVAHALALLRVVLEHSNGAGDLADLVMAIVAIDGEFALAFGDGRQRGRHRRQRLGHPAHDQHGQQHHQQRGDPGCDRHGLHAPAPACPRTGPWRCRHR